MGFDRELLRNIKVQTMIGQANLLLYLYWRSQFAYGMFSSPRVFVRVKISFRVGFVASLGAVTKVVRWVFVFNNSAHLDLLI